MEVEWYDRAWKRRKKLTGNKDLVSGNEPLIDFPAPFAITDADLAKHAQRSGDDILFTAADGKTKLSHQIQFWDPSIGRLVAYVKIPSLSPKIDTVIYIYYSNPESQNQQNATDLWRDYVYRKHFRHDPFAPLGIGGNDVLDETGTPVILKFLRAQIAMLEDLFGPQFFHENIQKIAGHPAYKRWRFCKELLSKNGRFRFPSDEPLLPELGKVLLENMSIVQCTRGELDSFSIGSLANYGDNAVQKRIRSNIKDPNKYLDIQTELQFAAWHLIRGHNVIAYEKSGADHKITTPTWRLPLVVDCKRIGADTSTSRIGKVIRKANKQVKELNIPCHGMVVIDLSEKVSNPRELRDDLPIELEEYREEIARALIDNNSSISAALLVWNDIHIRKPIHQGGSLIMVVLRTLSEVIKHKKPNYSLDKAIDSIKFGNTIEFFIRLDNK